ncbi:MAG: tetraacyldisaccharide 4'-kinase [Alphaproteobacteria bacterium]|nr:tetraacyldisaccharide 4'-kinase [Alphaproteobacteria bacterium]
MKTPQYWQHQNLISSLLTPIGALYSMATALRLKWIKPYQANVPVICIGNITAGGVGKTPVSIALAELLKANGKNPFFISRGYGGSLSGVLIDLKKHTPQEVGDEPLMLAAVAPTVVCADRGIAAQIAEKNGADVLIMDDGFQNPTLKKDLSFLVFNGELGIGNGKTIPAGPLREGLKSGLKRADGVIFIGRDKYELLKQINKPVFRVLIKEERPAHHNTKVIAFAGIGYPQKFYNSLQKCGLAVANSYDFPDHHFYTKDELKALIKKGKTKNLPIYTTLKDYVKIPQNLQKSFNVLNIKAQFEDKNQILDFIKTKAFR